MSKIQFDFERLITDMDVERRRRGLSVRALGREWGIRPATIVEWRTKRRRPAFEHVLMITAWLGADVNGYVQQVS